MPNLMSSSATQVEVRGRTTRDGVSKNVAAILVEGGGARGSGAGGEVADAEEASTEVGEEVDVQVGIGPFAEGGFHLGVVVAGGPVVVRGEVGANKGELDVGGAVGAVHVCKLSMR